MKNKFAIILSALLFFNLYAYAEEIIPAQPAQTQAIVAYTNYRDCIKLYKIPANKLFFLTLSAIHNNKFQLLEMQSRNGYLIFEENGREFLLNVMKKDNNHTFLRLTPADNNYYFSPTIPQKIFNYIDSKTNAEIQEMKI